MSRTAQSIIPFLSFDICLAFAVARNDEKVDSECRFYLFEIANPLSVR